MEKKVVSYRLPLHLIEQIRESAIAEHRCINNQIIHLLTKALGKPKKITVKEPNITVESVNDAEQIAEQRAALDRQNGDKSSS